MLQIFFCIILLLTSAFTGAPMMEVSGRNNGGGSPSTITGITLSNNSFSGGAADGTVVGAITVQGSNNGAATLSITGTDGPSGNNRFRLSSTNLVLNNTQAAGTYSINLVATLSGATGSPFTQPESITGSGALAAGFVVDVASHGGTCNDSFSNVQGLSVATPFCTLQRAQTAMQQTSTKTTYVRAGTIQALNYTSIPACSSSNAMLLLGGSDAGETWQYYPPDGYNTAVIDAGPATTDGETTNRDQGFCINTSNVTINGLSFTHFGTTPIFLFGNSNTVTNNRLYNAYDAPIGAGVAVGGCSVGNKIYHNDIRHTARSGVNLQVNCTGTNTDVRWNFVDDASFGDNDSGGLYTILSSGDVYIGNYIRNTSLPFNGNGGRCIYLDQPASFQTANNNICTGIFGNGLFNHAGNHNNMNGNIFDLWTANNQQVLASQYSGVPNTDMTANTVQHSIIITKNNSGGGGGYSNVGIANPNPTTVSDNLYFNYGSGGVYTHGDADVLNGTGNDPNPTITDPLFLTCPGGGVDSWSFKLNPASPAFGGTVTFPAQTNNDLGIGYGQAGYWGPPGFTIPHTGNPPSYGPC